MELKWQRGHRPRGRGEAGEEVACTRQTCLRKHAFASSAMARSISKGFSGKFCKGSNRVHLKLFLKSVPSISKHSDFLLLLFRAKGRALSFELVR